MAHDAFLFRDEISEIRSGFLASILRRWQGYANERSSAGPWFAAAVASWQQLSDRMPTGFRTLNLDEWLTSETRCVEFLAAVDWVRADILKSIEAGDFNRTGLPFEETFAALKSLVATKPAGSIEDRQVLFDHKSKEVTTHYSAPEIGNLVDAANQISKSRRSPAQTVLRLVRAENRL